MKKFAEIPKDQLITFNLSSDSTSITSDAQEIIVDTVADKLFLSWPIEKRQMYLAEMEAGRQKVLSYEVEKEFQLSAFEWAWKTQRGTLPKRIDSWYYKRYNQSLGNDALSAIGNIARRDLPKDKEYIFDITQKLDWKEGEFGDSTSCLFDNTHLPGTTLKAMDANPHCFAIRFFKKFSKEENVEGFAKKFYETENEFYIGISRAWVLNNFYIRRGWNNSSPLTDYVGIFNGYGFETRSMARVLSSYMETSDPKYVYLSSDIYVNGDGCYIIDERQDDKRVQADIANGINFYVGVGGDLDDPDD